MDNKETDKSQMNGSMKDMNQLHLEKVTYLNWHDVEDLRLTKEQKNYLPDNVSNLALAGVIREAGFHVFTFGIYLGEKPIGFVMIGYGRVIWRLPVLQEPHEANIRPACFFYAPARIDPLHISVNNDRKHYLRRDASPTPPIRPAKLPIVQFA